MAQTSCMMLTTGDREYLATIIADHNRPLKHVQRARIILRSGERFPVLTIAERAGVRRPAVWGWQQRCAEEGVEGLPWDKTRPPGKAPMPPEMGGQGPRDHLLGAPGRSHALDWVHRGRGCWDLTSDGSAHLGGPSPAAAPDADVQALERPHLRREGRGQRWPLYEPTHTCRGPVHRRVVSIQAVSCTRPGTLVRPARPATMTHDYTRHGTTTLFAALNVLDGTVLGRCKQRHRHQEYIRFLNTVEASVPAGKLIHAILDNYAVHKPPKVRAWLSRHPRWIFHFTRPRPHGSTRSRPSSRH